MCNVLAMAISTIPIPNCCSQVHKLGRGKCDDNDLTLNPDKS